ncbi:HNH endonuclease [Pediococcus argentinicus]|uniref:HNH endonuclease signature motif containing protein n=1 Tax=Pediococcus argentinicus TaxID=480391 RepID=UPI00338FE146
MSKHYCNHAGCRELIPLTVKYCEKHKKQANSETYHRRLYNSSEARYQQFYKSTAWKKLSRQMMIKMPICQSCYKEGVIRKADIIDHIIPIREDWSKRLDENNMQSLCIYHHNQKTNIEVEKRNGK